VKAIEGWSTPIFNFEGISGNRLFSAPNDPMNVLLREKEVRDWAFKRPDSSVFLIFSQVV